MSSMMRVGIGYDVHQWAEKRPLILGGITIPHPQGLAGHSDADVLSHAITDALLGALALGDLGKHFPDTDPAYKDADSMTLLHHAVSLVHRQGYSVGNVDATVVAEKPKLALYIEAMRRRLADTLNAPFECVSVKATTTEGLLYTGNPGGMAAYAVCLLVRDYQ